MACRSPVMLTPRQVCPCRVACVAIVGRDFTSTLFYKLMLTIANIFLVHRFGARLWAIQAAIIFYKVPRVFQACSALTVHPPRLGVFF